MEGEVTVSLSKANRQFERGQYADAIASYRDFIERFPDHADAMNNLGAALCKLGIYGEAEERFRRSIEIAPDNSDAHANLGNLLRWTGRVSESEVALRLALKLNPRSPNARAGLGFTLLLLGRLRESKARFAKVLKSSPRHADALFGLGQIARLDGQFDEARAKFERALESEPLMPGPWAALAGIRKMTKADVEWFAGAEKIIAAGVPPIDEVDLRFAMGKYCDDIEDYDRAFENYRLGNTLLKNMAPKYERAERKRFVDDMVRAHTLESCRVIQKGASSSDVPVFVIGMMRSGTTLAEQIVASHPLARGVGELSFWSDAAREHASAVRDGTLGEEERTALAAAYLQRLESDAGAVRRIVDKATVNSDHVGLIHSVFPRARFIYLQRDPIDTCLSCYFQRFSLSLNFTMDLSDLAHYYREHRRLIAHWRSVLPPEVFLDVSYSELVIDQEGVTARMLKFLGLEWDARCLNFHETKRSVVTASFWQVRQKMYNSSLGRWQHYKKFIRPLLELQELEHVQLRGVVSR
jgi:tetratricopeptide (TPR) repeat protein